MNNLSLVLVLVISVSCSSGKSYFENEQRFLELFFDSRVNEHAASLIENMHAETVTYFNLSPSNEYLRGYLIAESSLFEGVQFEGLDYRIIDFEKSSKISDEELEFFEQYKPKSAEVVRIKIEINPVDSPAWILTTFVFVDWETRKVYDIFIPYSL